MTEGETLHHAWKKNRLTSVVTSARACGVGDDVVACLRSERETRVAWWHRWNSRTTGANQSGPDAYYRSTAKETGEHSGTQSNANSVGGNRLFRQTFWIEDDAKSRRPRRSEQTRKWRPRGRRSVPGRVTRRPTVETREDAERTREYRRKRSRAQDAASCAETGKTGPRQVVADTGNVRRTDRRGLRPTDGKIWRTRRRYRHRRPAGIVWYARDAFAVVALGAAVAAAWAAGAAGEASRDSWRSKTKESVNVSLAGPAQPNRFEAHWRPADAAVAAALSVTYARVRNIFSTPRPTKFRRRRAGY